MTVDPSAGQAAGVAVGIAVYRAVAGPADQPPHFLAGMHVTGLVTAGLFLVAALTTLALVAGRRDRA